MIHSRWSLFLLVTFCLLVPNVCLIVESMKKTTISTHGDKYIASEEQCEEQAWSNCQNCKHLLDCAGECSIDNNCQGFNAYFNKKNNRLKKCRLISFDQGNCLETIKTSKSKAKNRRFFLKTKEMLKNEIIGNGNDQIELENVILSEYGRKEMIDAFDSAICGGGTSRILYDPYAKVAKGKIIGGSDAKPGEFPYQVLLYFSFIPKKHEQFINDSNRDDSKFWMHSICGASIIDREWLLTAAHCFNDE